MITKDLNSQLREKYNPDGSNRRLSQLRMVELLKFLDSFCKRNSIDYWIDSGTLLGAVRHGGFIPWDDDIDVCMKRKDYLKFLKLFGNKQFGDFVLQTHQNDKGYFRFWSVVRDLKSEYIHSDDMPCEHMLKYRGLLIDVFPVIDRYTTFSIKIARAISWRVNYYYTKEAYSKYHIYTKLFFYLSKIIVFPLLRFFFRKKQDKFIFDYGVGFYSKRIKNDVYPLSKIMFEGEYFKCPNNPDGYCRILYGDNYMDMPSEDQIYDHNTTVLFKDI